MPSSEMLVDLTLRSFTEKLASADAAPGGGSATAVAGAMGAALASMVARLTVGRQRYAENEVVMQAVLSQAERLRGQLLALVDADSAAFLKLMEAYRLPKGNEEERIHREAVVQEALCHAVDLPLATVEACVQVLNIAALAAENGNPNAASDAAVAGLLAHAALLGAASNVRINLKLIQDVAFNAAAEARLSGLIVNAEDALKRALGG